MIFEGPIDAVVIIHNMDVPKVIRKGRKMLAKEKAKGGKRDKKRGKKKEEKEPQEAMKSVGTVEYV